MACAHPDSNVTARPLKPLVSSLCLRGQVPQPLLEAGQAGGACPGPGEGLRLVAWRGTRGVDGLSSGGSSCLGVSTMVACSGGSLVCSLNQTQPQLPSLQCTPTHTRFLGPWEALFGVQQHVASAPLGEEHGGSCWGVPIFWRLGAACRKAGIALPFGRPQLCRPMLSLAPSRPLFPAREAPPRPMLRSGGYPEPPRTWETHVANQPTQPTQ